MSETFYGDSNFFNELEDANQQLSGQLETAITKMFGEAENEHSGFGGDTNEEASIAAARESARRLNENNRGLYGQLNIDHEELEKEEA